ncbi:hypothetical protein [Desulfofalx alkaliphila]|uniref:hypothetical protein n=1 Tax=Desulfofalx alkaliphila TaxID=105483 RepID=UPI001A9A4535|nr:hypothetical protein [Desulfofalx alkaliphila]
MRFDSGNEFANDLEEVVEKVNAAWKGDRIFEIIEYSGLSVKMAYRALDLIRGRRTLTRHLQKVSTMLAYDKQWNEKVTRKAGTIFTVKIIGHQRPESIADTEIDDGDIVDREPTTNELLKQILDTLIDIREEIKK